ncbi:MAG: SDR family NAD(P)-dependent oxidoreductase [Myxococcota bacterium]
MEQPLLITGGTQGIGRALVDHYRMRARVLTCGRDEASINELNALEGVEAIRCDLTIPEERLALIQWAERHSLAGVINNAAVQEPLVVDHADAARVEREVQLNLLAPLAIGHALLSRIEVGGFIANLSSGLAYVPFRRAPVYAATKAALSMYTRSAQLQPSRVRWVEVILPMVDTAMTRGRGRGKIPASLAALQIARGIEAGRPRVHVGKARMLPLVLRTVPSLLGRMLNQDAPKLPATSVEI